MCESDGEIHSIVQARSYDFVGLIRERGPEIDEHLLSCEACRKKMRGWSSWFPKHFARVVVEPPESWKGLRHSDKLRRLQRGQCLPCGCEVVDTAWTRDEARDAFYRALARLMEMPYEDAVLLSELTRLRDLPATVVQLRRLRDAFWIPDGSLATEEGRDLEEGIRVLRLPETVGEFVTKIARMHSGMSYAECTTHWNP